MESLTPTVEIRSVLKDELWKVRVLAHLIFPETYREIVAADQIDYMMDLFYTPEALVAQLKSGQVFLIIYFEGRASGYASYTRMNDAGDFKLNKIYVDNRLQGRGLGRKLLNDVISKVKSEGGRTLQLNVNRNNKATGFYENMGFSVLKEELLDIGNNFFMDDYVMSLNLTKG